MTREEADKLQELINEYVELKDPPKGQSKRKAKTRKSIVTYFRWRLTCQVERVLPPAPTIAGLDMGLVLGPLVSLFKPQPGHMVAVPVVEGHDAALLELERDEWEKTYCIQVPSDVYQKAAMQRTQNTLVDKVFEREPKPEPLPGADALKKLPDLKKLRDLTKGTSE